MGKIGIIGSDEFIEVENVYCIGKNYVEHIKEFDDSKAEIPAEPIIFLKPNTSVRCNSEKISIPEFKGKKISDNLQNEVELVIVIGKNGEKVDEDKADDYILGYAAGIDFTLRDVQSEFKKKGLPWTLSKGFIGSAPVSEIKLKEKVRNPQNLKIQLSINGEVKQNSNTSLMIFNIGYLVYYISHIFGLKRGDLIFTGTPAGITKLNKSDIIHAEIENIGELNIKIE